MYKITNQHNLPDKKSIDVEFFFNDYNIRKEFFEKDIFLNLTEAKKITKGKNEKEVTEHKEVICIRHSEKRSAYYTLPSVFILKSNIAKCRTIMRNYLKREVYDHIYEKDKATIVKVFDYLKSMEIDFIEYKEMIIDFVVNFEKRKYPFNLNVFPEILELKENINDVEFSKDFRFLLSKYDVLYYEKNKEKIIQREKREEIKRVKEAKKRKELQEIKKIEDEKRMAEEKIIREKRLKDFSQILESKKNKLNKYCEVEITENIIFNIKKAFSNWLITNIKAKLNYNDYINYLLNFDEEQIKLALENNIKIKEIFSINLSLGNKSNRKSKQNSFKSSFYAMLNKEVKRSLFYSQVVSFVFFNKKFNIDFILKKSLFKKEENFNEYVKEIRNINIDILLKEHLVKMLNESFDNGMSKKFLSYIEKTNHSNYNKKISFKNIIDLNCIKEKLISNFESVCDFNSLIKTFVAKNKKSLTIYKSLFNKARERKREILYFSGVTNSGKTYSAFEELKKYKKGVYLAPLRLLAIEGQEEITKRGFKCSLMTGEERDIVPKASFMSSTIEMLNIEEEYDVAIIDEIQMLNSDRGAAWLQALVGVNAKKVIIVGSNEVKEPVKKIVNYLEEPLTYKEFNRKSKLSTGKQSRIDETLEPNSAVIAFSKRDLYSLKSHYENLGNTVSIIYGKLPPAVKISESNKFRNGETEVLVSTDAIGMGLNLPIKNLYFYSTEKYNGYGMESLPETLVKQISGRAGRFGMFEEGVVSAFSRSDLSYVKNSLKADTIVDSLRVETMMTLAIFEELLKINKERNLKEILKLYDKLKFDIAICNNKEQYNLVCNEINNRLDYFSNKDIVKLLNAPVNSDKYDKYENFFKTIIGKLIIFREKGEKSYMFKTEQEMASFIGRTISSLDYEESYKILDLLHFFMFNFREFENCEKYIVSKKQEISKEIKKLIKLKRY